MCNITIYCYLIFIFILVKKLFIKYVIFNNKIEKKYHINFSPLIELEKIVNFLTSLCSPNFQTSTLLSFEPLINKSLLSL